MVEFIIIGILFVGLVYINAKYNKKSEIYKALHKKTN